MTSVRLRCTGLAGLFVLISMSFTPATASEDYWTRSEGISSGAGDAIARNKAIQTIDPWPAHAGRTKMRMDGERMLLSIDRYQKNKSPEPEGLNDSGSGGDSVQPQVTP